MSSMIKTQKAVKSTKTEMTADEKKRKEAILAQYSQVCDGEYPFSNHRMLQLETGTCSAQSGSQIVNNNNYIFIPVVRSSCPIKSHPSSCDYHDRLSPFMSISC